MFSSTQLVHAIYIVHTAIITASLRVTYLRTEILT